MDINDMIAENVGLVYSQLNRFELIYDQDAESYAYEALYRAAVTYNESAGTKFSTYAVCVISNALRKHLRTLNKKRQLDVISYHDIIPNGDDAHDFMDLIPLSDNESNAEDIVLFKELQGVVGASFAKVYATLSDKHKSIIDAWYNSDYRMTQCEIARALQISQPTVSKALSVFKYRLKLELEEYM